MAKAVGSTLEASKEEDALAAAAAAEQAAAGSIEENMEELQTIILGHLQDCGLYSTFETAKRWVLVIPLSVVSIVRIDSIEKTGVKLTWVSEPPSDQAFLDALEMAEAESILEIGAVYEKVCTLNIPSPIPLNTDHSMVKTIHVPLEGKALFMFISIPFETKNDDMGVITVGKLQL